MQKIEISTPEPQKLLPILRDAIERQKQLLLQSLARTEERIRQLAANLHVDVNLLMAGGLPHPEEQEMDLLELEGELELLRHIREQLDSLDHLTLCP
jgi:hypothetical protein